MAAGDLIDPLPYADGGSSDGGASDGASNGGASNGGASDDFGDGSDTSSERGDAAADPHFWTDPQRMLEVVVGLEVALAESVDPLDLDALAAAVSSYRERLVALDTELAASFAGIPDDRRALVTNHHVFGYLAERYDFRVIGAVIPSGTTLAAPSASDLDSLVTAIDESGVTTVFADSSQPDRLIRVLADEADLDIDVVPLFTESLTRPGGGAETYLKMMRANERLITTGLSP